MGQCFTTEEEAAHVRHHLRAEALFHEAHLGKGRGGNPGRHATGAKLRVKLTRIRDVLFGEAEQGAAREQTQIKIHHGEVKGERRLIEEDFSTTNKRLFFNHPIDKGN